jgi:transcriptional/translational regulatory protein YebC/TACO1
MARREWLDRRHERLGYVAKQFPTLTEEQAAEAGEFLQSLEDHDDVHRVWAAIK